MIDVDALAAELVAELPLDRMSERHRETGKRVFRERFARVLADALPKGWRLDDPDKAERARLRQLERVVLNQLGTTDPREVAAFCVRARLGRSVSDEDMAALIGAPLLVAPGTLEKMRLGDKPDEGIDFGHVARCAPQADGASEQDVIGLQRAYTASVDGC